MSALLQGMRSKGQRGFTMITVAVSITALLALAALAIDMGLIYTARTHAQHAADAAALAGAYTFTNNLAVQPGAAQEAAVAAAGANQVLGEAATITADDVIVDLPNRRVTVNVNRVGANAVRTKFAAAVGVNTVGLRARATAQCAVSAANGGSRCVKPVYVPNTVLSDLSHTEACDQQQFLFDPATKQLTAFAQTYFNSTQVNTSKILRPTRSSEAVAPGQFYSLDFGSGGQDYRCTLANCVTACGGSSAIRCGNSFPLKTGNMVGPTTDGFNDLIGNPPQDAWVSSGRYREIASGIIKDSSRALVTVPVWDDCAQPITSGTAGQQLVVIGFVQMFVSNVVQSGANRGDTSAHFVSATSCAAEDGGPSGGDPGGVSNGPTGPMALPIQLIQNPQN